ncbi:glycosyltransferase family 9 protein [Agarivorans sp. 1_MG-2023]|uniref:glycosyltransferase family 9 protein n=1 Tax=Agarivorans sp. 1_MG-2023 TaxID=3062634 RepID=UPI0026E1E0E8|nr:glycosyltransferase family 9 protein [Agarivorans sp. 1_MG-2023]MDO6764325.1 glycosyltransferase family 9 protein [Agarivorans sp. 1_MG-2023]
MKICILRLSAIGDVCNALAVVQQLQQALPQVEVTWICGKAEAQLLALYSDITVVVYDKKQGLKGLLALRRQLANQQFDILWHMQAALRSSLVSCCIKAKRRIGFDKSRAKDGQWLFTNEKVLPASSPHVLDGFLQFLSQLDIAPKPVHWQVPLSKQDIEFAQDLLNIQGNDKGKHILICAAASKSYKNWTLEGYVGIAQHALQQGFQVSLIGSPTKSEVALAEHINQACNQQLNNLCGQTSLSQLWALIAQADLLISPDTGPAHMAVAVNTPVLGLYAHHNPQRTGPYHYRHYVVSVWQQLIEQEQGKAADQLNWRSRLKDPNAMQHITLDAVIEMFETIKQEQQL